MTLADLCTALIERESVIHSFHGTANRDFVRIQGIQQRVTDAAKALKVFTCRELVAASGCSHSAAYNWLRANDSKTIAKVGPSTVFNGDSAMAWRWL